jgi:hypothetical protein
LNQADDENDDRDDEKDVNEAAEGVARDQAQEPENQQDDENGPKHDGVSSYSIEPPEAARGVYSEARASFWAQSSRFKVQGFREDPPLNLTLKNPAELAARMELDTPDRVLLIDSPEELTALLVASRPEPKTTLETSGDAIRAVKDRFDAVLVWREHRSGSRSIFDGVLKRLEPGGSLWVVTALKKVRGPTTPAVHRLELSDLVKAFTKEGLTHDREVRVSAWHVGYRFVKRKT